jgi:Tfp pilus assembly protein PilO
MWQAEPGRVLRALALGLNVAGAVLTVAVVVGVWWLGEPRTRCSPDASQRLDACRELLRNEVRVRADHARLRQQLDAARQKDQALRQRIPDGPHEADFLAQISQAAGETELQITDYRHGVVTAGQPCSSVQVELSCEGDYRSICRLLDRLRELPRHSTVARIEIHADATRAKCLAKICLELYFFGRGRQAAERQA